MGVHSNSYSLRSSCNYPRPTNSIHVIAPTNTKVASGYHWRAVVNSSELSAVVSFLLSVPSVGRSSSNDKTAAG